MNVMKDGVLYQQPVFLIVKCKFALCDFTFRPTFGCDPVFSLVLDYGSGMGAHLLITVFLLVESTANNDVSLQLLTLKKKVSPSWQ